MKALITQSGQFGPFTHIETLADRYRCDGVDYQFDVIGTATVGDWVDPGPTAEQLAKAKADKNMQINLWRAAANQSYFTYSGKQIACDQLSRSDIDAVAGSISLTGAFPTGFPNAWKATDNTYIPIPDIATFKAMYAAMTLQGTQNFGHSQSLKATVAAATTLDQINAVVW